MKDGRKKNIILVLRYLGDGTLTESKPCRLCLEAILKAGITKVAYSNFLGQIIQTTIFHLLGEPIYITPGIQNYGDKFYLIKRRILKKIHS